MIPRHALFVLAVCVLFQMLAFGYLRDFGKIYTRPHTWRQADGYSVAVNYFYDGMDFWHPRLNNQHAEEGYAVGEFPILYYASAIGLLHFQQQLRRSFHLGRPTGTQSTKRLLLRPHRVRHVILLDPHTKPKAFRESIAPYQVDNFEGIGLYTIE